MKFITRVPGGALAVSLSAIFLTAVLAPAHAQGVLNGGFLGLYQPGVVSVTTPTFQRRDARIDFTWTQIGPGGSLSPEFNTAAWQNFSGSWAGTVIPATSETYTFTVK